MAWPRPGHGQTMETLGSHPVDKPAIFVSSIKKGSNGEVHAQGFTLARACSVSAQACSAFAMDPQAAKWRGGVAVLLCQDTLALIIPRKVACVVASVLPQLDRGGGSCLAVEAQGLHLQTPSFWSHGDKVAPHWLTLGWV